MIPQVQFPHSYLPIYPPPYLSQLQISHSSVPPSEQYQSHMDIQISSVSPIAYNSPQSSTQPMSEFSQMDSGLAIPVFNQGDDPIAYLNKAMAFLTAVASLRNAAWFKEKAMLAEAYESGQILDEEQLAFLADPGVPESQSAQTTIPNNATFHTEDLDAYDSDCDDVFNAKAVLMANLSNYGSDVISEVDVQDTNLYAQQDLMILSMIEQMSEQMINHTNSVLKFIRKKLFLENDRILQKIMSQDIMICVMSSTTVFNNVNLEMHNGEFCVKCLDLDAELLNKQNAYNDLSKSYSQLEKHCISIELTMQLNQEIFQKDSSSDNQNAFKIPEYFENNDLKAQLQAKDTTIYKLKENIKSMRENDKKEKVKHDMDEIETINIELEHSVAKLLYVNERLHKEIEHLKRFTKINLIRLKRNVVSLNNTVTL
nr:hypothetical protein [Tanacetum cinerariifolium]